MAVPIFLSGQQVATAAVAWMCLMGAEKGTRWIEKATLVTGGTRLVPNPQKWRFFQEGAEAWRKHGYYQVLFRVQVVSSLPAPLLSLPRGSPGIHRDTQHIVASYPPSSPSIAVRRCPRPTRSQKTMGQGGARVPCFPWAHGLRSADGKRSKY